MTHMDLRIGQGYDVHALVPGRPLIIGGVTIPYERGLLGHSDADVLLHAITDAIFGAAAMGDIGRHFSDTDAKFAGADSRVLLRECFARVKAAGFSIANVDSSVVAQAPKLAPHIEGMRANIAADLDLPIERVNVKAKTNEKLGYLGRGEGIEAQAAVLLVGGWAGSGCFPGVIDGAAYSVAPPIARLAGHSSSVCRPSRMRSTSS